MANTKLEKTVLLAKAALEKLQSLEAVAAEDATWVAARAALARAEAAGTGVDEAKIALTKLEEEKCAQLEAELRSAVGDFEHGDGTFEPVKAAEDAAKVWFELPIARSALARAHARVAYETEAAGIKIDKTIIK